MRQAPSEFRFLWFVAAAALLHGIIVSVYFLPKQKPYQERKPEQRIHVELKNFNPSVPATTLMAPKPAVVPQKSEPLTHEEIKPLETVKQPKPIEPERRKKNVLKRKKPPALASALLKEPKISPPPKPAPAAPKAAPPAEAAPPGPTIASPSPIRGTKPSLSRSEKGAKESFDEYLALIRAKIKENQRYPLLARRGRQEGTVTVTFTLMKDGNLHGDPTVAQSSGYRSLDKAGLDSVKKAAPFPSIPEAMGKDRIKLSLNIAFLLTE